MVKGAMQSYKNDYLKRLQRPITQFEYNFSVWIDDVERIVYKRIQKTLDELGDDLYMFNFEHGMTSREMAKIVIQHYNEYAQFILQTIQP
jgi:hypothetical protein